jgi:hypothetical protein
MNVGGHHGAQPGSNQPGRPNYLLGLVVLSVIVRCTARVYRSRKPHYARGGVCSTPAHAYKTLQEG